MSDGARRWRGAVLALALLAACGRKASPIAPELARPLPPEGLSAIATPDGIRLAWQHPLRYAGGQRMNDLAGFAIERAPGEGATATFAAVGRLDVDDQTRFQKEHHREWLDRDVVAGARYLYRVRALTLDGYRSAPTEPVAIRFGPAPGDAPDRKDPPS
jgi:hypothetical protein